jgi:hypothetical protein
MVKAKKETYELRLITFKRGLQRMFSIVEVYFNKKRQPECGVLEPVFLCHRKLPQLKNKVSTLMEVFNKPILDFDNNLKTYREQKRRKKNECACKSRPY